MEFHEAATYLFDLRRYSPRTGLEETRDLLAELGDPHDDLPAVQIAGSNGKGSTARLLERALREAGLDVGLFTSPHLDDLRERVRVNGRPVSRATLVEFVEEIRQYVDDRAAENASPTFFETMTAFGLWEFARQDVDVAVMEVGIGGTHDATSVVNPVASAVTSITLEHQDVLGDTIPEIATDLAGVAPIGRPLVTAATGDALDEVRDHAGEVRRVDGDDAADVQVIHDGRVGLEAAVSLTGEGWRVETHLPLLGAYQARNAGVAAALAWQVADELDREVTERDLAKGFRNAHWPGRFEVMSREPLVVLDGAHNPGGCRGLTETLSTFAYDDIHVVFGAMTDKDHGAMARALPEAATVHTCRPDLERAETTKVLATTFERETGATVHEGGAVEAALTDALAAAGSDDAVVVCGSLFVVAAARRRWTRIDVPKTVRDLDIARAVLEDSAVPAETINRVHGSGVHRVLKTSLRPRQATRLKQALLAEGGECAVSGVTAQDREPVDVVMLATLAQFERVLDRFHDEGDGLSGVAEQIRRTLGLVDAESGWGYPWEDGTAVMGILNVTPDSFHDGGRYVDVEDAVVRARAMVEAGADIVDVGGESTRPGADPVPVNQEIDRVVPVVEQLADLDALVSVDTRKATVARAALDAGADLVNDVSGLEDPEMRLVAAEHDVPVVVMHSIETPVAPGTAVEYDDVVEDTINELVERVLLAERAGLDRSQIIVDPGLGFGKASTESFELLGRIDEFHALGCPVLVGHSHKSMFDQVGYGEGERLHATVAGTALAAANGADIVRVHDVAANIAAIRTVDAARDPDDA